MSGPQSGWSLWSVGEAALGHLVVCVQCCCWGVSAGLVSQSIPGGNVNIEWNESGTKRWSLSRFIGAVVGSGLRHKVVVVWSYVDWVWEVAMPAQEIAKGSSCYLVFISKRSHVEGVGRDFGSMDHLLFDVSVDLANLVLWCLREAEWMKLESEASKMHWASFGPCRLDKLAVSGCVGPLRVWGCGGTHSAVAMLHLGGSDSSCSGQWRSQSLAMALAIW